LRLAFLGSPPFAVASFAAVLAAELEVVGLVTAPVRTAGRGRKEARNPLVEMAEAAGIPVLRPESARAEDFRAAFKEWDVDLGVVVSFGQLLDEKTLGLPRLGCVNLHGSLLPRWRGASPVQAAILAGDTETGLSLQKMVLALDAGDVLAETALPLDGTEDAPTLTGTLAQHGADFLVHELSAIASSGVLPEGKPQNADLVTTCRKVTKADGVLDWTQPAVQIGRRVRAMAGWPSGQAKFPDGSGLRVHAGTALPDATTGSDPGTILSLAGGITVACGVGAYRIDALQRDGKARMSATDFLRGARLEEGQTLLSA
jgi:methionyl-tRNA formyltransferase